MRNQLKKVLAAILATLTIPTAAWAGKPLKVFILSGQSNMVGTGSITTFPAIGMDPETVPMLKQMLNAEGNPVVCDNVYITSAPNPGEEAKHGKLEVGYGSSSGGKKIGPEYTFGIYAHQMLGEPILLIKVAWGGKSLMGQFRPPSAGGDKPTGPNYTMMMDHIKKVLADPKAVYPDYDTAAGYELAGFVWFQGYNDYITKAYPYVDEAKGKGSAKDYSEYTRLLGCFIRDIRKELAAPKMPFVVGVFGMEGKQADETIQSFRKAQAATADLPEFKGNVINVFTENYWPERISEIKAKESIILKGEGKGKNLVIPELQGEAAEVRQAIWDMSKEGDLGKKTKKKGEKSTEKRDRNAIRARIQKKDDLMYKLRELCFSREDAELLKVGVSNQSYHYWGSAKFYGQAGKAFAEAIPGIQKTHP